ncbi:MAG: urease accessory protein UreD [Verrucomicrobiae bacterium]|nr:urease accessory protein UreD [Verrucomicrobiae bacterium]
MTTAEPVLVSSRTSVHGGVRLRYESDGPKTTLKQQWVRPPLHLAKTYHDKSWAINLLTSPTAGLLEGDSLEVDCKVEAGAKAALISPAACRVHTMTNGEATIRQHYHVGEDAVLDIWPAPIILQTASRLTQETIVEVEASSTLLLTEIVSPGRAAYGESFQFDFWRSRLRIYRPGTLAAYENFQVVPQTNDVADWRTRFPHGPYVGIYFLTPHPVSGLIEPLHDLSNDDVAIGASPLRAGGLGIKLLARDSPGLRKSVITIREVLIERTGINFPNTLQRAQTFFY